MKVAKNRNGNNDMKNVQLKWKYCTHVQFSSEIRKNLHPSLQIVNCSIFSATKMEMIKRKMLVVALTVWLLLFCFATGK